MKLFQTSGGFTIAFGFDIRSRAPNDRIICWNDPMSGEWDTTAANQAGWNLMAFHVMPEFVFEVNGKVMAYQSGLCIEMTYIGNPLVWSFKLLEPDRAVFARRAA